MFNLLEQKLQDLRSWDILGEVGGDSSNIMSLDIFHEVKIKQEAHGRQVAHLSDIATLDMQMLWNISITF